MALAKPSYPSPRVGVAGERGLHLPLRVPFSSPEPSLGSRRPRSPRGARGRAARGRAGTVPTRAPCGHSARCSVPPWGDTPPPLRPPLSRCFRWHVNLLDCPTLGGRRDLRSVRPGRARLPKPTVKGRASQRRHEPARRNSPGRHKDGAARSGVFPARRGVLPVFRQLSLGDLLLWRLRLTLHVNVWPPFAALVLNVFGGLGLAVAVDAAVPFLMPTA